MYPSQNVRFRTVREVCRSRRPIMVRSTGGCFSVFRLNETITLSAALNRPSVTPFGSSPARISSRGCAPGSCARTRAIIPSNTQDSTNSRLTYLLGYQVVIKSSLVQMYQGVLRKRLMFNQLAETGYSVSASRK